MLAIAFSRLHVEAQLRHQALHDSLTGLPNRALFLDRLGHALALRAASAAAAVLFVDLDDFKGVNDILGHGAGDEVWSRSPAPGRRVRPADTVARLGGDEFVVAARTSTSAPRSRSAGGSPQRSRSRSGGRHRASSSRPASVSRSAAAPPPP